MSQSRHTANEIAQLGESIYSEKLRSQVEPDHKGEFLVLDITTGEYEIDASDVDALQRLRNRLPDAVIYGVRIGRRAAYRIGGFSRVRD